MSESRITPSLWFNMNAEEAMNYYCDVFSDAKINHVEYYPDESLDKHFQGMKGQVINGDFELLGQRFLCLDGGPQFSFTEAVSFTISCKDQAEIDHYWEQLSHTPQAEACGWCRDKFGVSWQIIPENMGALVSSPAAVQAMMKMKKIVINDLKNA